MRVGPIEIYETDSEIIANLRPDESIEVVDRKEPTLKHPEILADYGIKNGKYHSLMVYYPKSKYSLEDILSRKDSLIEKRDPDKCLGCQRKQKQLISELSGMIDEKEQVFELALVPPIPPRPPLPHELLPPPPLPPQPPFSPPLPHEVLEELFG